MLDPTDGTSIDISADGKLRLVVSTNALRPEQLEVLRAFADQLAMAVEARRLRVDAANADLLSEANALRAALLQAVSHDFRTPLATIKASASGLLHTDAAFSDSDRRLLLVDIDDAADRLDRMVRDLLDMSRLQVGALDLDAAVPWRSRRSSPPRSPVCPPHRAGSRSTCPSRCRRCSADAALLERAVANLVSNAVAWSPDGSPVKVQAGQIGELDRPAHRRPRARASPTTNASGSSSRSNASAIARTMPVSVSAWRSPEGFIEAMGAQSEPRRHAGRRADDDDPPAGRRRGGSP